MLNIRFWIHFFKFFSFLLLTSCGSLKVSTIETIKTRISPDYIGPAEPAYCDQSSISQVNTVLIEGFAKYNYREFETFNENTDSFEGLGDISETPKPIRYVEYVILDELDQQVQCGETDSTGKFSFTVPQGDHIYRLQIRSRAFNNFYKASVMKAPENNSIYFIEKVFEANQKQEFGDLIAPATGSLLGGAFFILDQIYEYNEKLRTLVGQCSNLSATGCRPFSVAPKIQIYWEKGFNPGSYFGSSASSFYYKDVGIQRLFILGGVDGDVDLSDTDHFDKSIIAHEYFHFLENNLGRSSSPGGFHDGNSIIDPRLAWSEGSAQFFQAVMTEIPYVLDTIGNKSGFSPAPYSNFNGLTFIESIETGEKDIPTESGEGEFREFSIARLLWDSFDDTEGESLSGQPTPITCSSSNIDNVHDKCAKDGFKNFWSVLTGERGFSNFNFISAGLFHKLHSSLVGNSPSPENNLSPLRVSEFHSPDQREFGQKLSGSCTSTKRISPPFTHSYAGEFFPNSSHSFNNMEFFSILHQREGPFALKLSATFNNSFTAEIDLFLFSESQKLKGEEPITYNLVHKGNYTGYSKSIEVPQLKPGRYLVVLDVRNFNLSNNGSVDVSLKYGSSLNSLGGILCVQ